MAQRLADLASRSPCTNGWTKVASRIVQATGFSSFAKVCNPKRQASRGMLPPPDIGSITAGSVRHSSSKPARTRSKVSGGS